MQQLKPSPFRQQPSPFKQRAGKSRTEPSSLEDLIQFCPCRGCERPCNTFGRSHLRLGPRNCGADHSQTERRGRRHKLHHVGRYGGVCVRYCGHIASPPRLAERCGRLSAGVSLPARARKGALRRPVIQIERTPFFWRHYILGVVARPLPTEPTFSTSSTATNRAWALSDRDHRADVHFGSLADITARPRHVRFTPKADILPGGLK